MTFRPGDPVEYDSAYKSARSDGCITYPGDRPAVIRGVYVKRVSDDYSDVAVAGCKPLLVKTNRLRARRAA